MTLTLYLLCGLVAAVTTLLCFGDELADEWHALNGMPRERAVFAGLVLSVTGGVLLAWPFAAVAFLLTQISD